jgi:putative ABC transport system substrate-binding protein
MNRRALVLAVVVLGFVAPSYSAQPESKVRRVGFFMARAPDVSLDEAFARGLRDAGYREGENIIVESRFANNQAEALPALAAEMARLKLDVIVVAPEQAALAMSKADPKVPLVLATAGDPVGTGLAATLARPGGRVTGLSNIHTDIIGKHIQLLKQTIPAITRVGFLTNTHNLTKATQLRQAQRAAESLNVELAFEEARGPDDIDRAFTALVEAHPQVLVVAIDPLMFSERGRLAELAMKHRLPAISPFREFADSGGLMAYGGSLVYMFRRSATYVDKILKGAIPAELPIEQPTTFNLVINLKTARALGITIPDSILLRADKVIE